MPEPSSAGAAMFLQPAQMWVADRPTRIKTVLGSCVAITMLAPRLGVGAMGHCLLPNAGAATKNLSRNDALKYVDSTVDLMLQAFARRGVVSDELEIKLFGGADNLGAGMGSYGVGNRNIEAAIEVLEARGIVPACSVVGGRRGRVIEFDTATGQVWVKRLSGVAANRDGEEP